MPLIANNWTFLSLIFAFFCFYMLYRRDYFIALFLFSIAAFLYFPDGAVARYRKEATKEGAYFDTITDRYVEFIVLYGIYCI
ncbi:MAG: CDP-alcohol phosphatidyltransferase family protein [Candidatus Aenigmarchaeota archaeon]|nr:CDP-alcohol phosphatidyltransferase family protein [Candidatus Aenigmarchaeota archaeon]